MLAADGGDAVEAQPEPRLKLGSESPRPLRDGRIHPAGSSGVRSFVSASPVGPLVLTEGRPTIAMETYIRLMVLKQRYRWGYRTLVAEVSDSIHLRRFCRISLTERVPDESRLKGDEGQQIWTEWAILSYNADALAVRTR